jgi:hypothetical protein
MVLCYVIFIRPPKIIEETFGDVLSFKKTPDALDIDKRFSNIIEYNNDADGRIGYDKCIQNCQGYCVEYGITGDAHCFPVQGNEEKDFYGDVVSNEIKLSFPKLD